MAADETKYLINKRFRFFYFKSKNYLLKKEDFSVNPTFLSAYCQ